MDTRPPTEVPAERPVEQTRVLPAVADGQDSGDPPASILPPHTTDPIRADTVGPDPDGGAGRHWATGSVPVATGGPAGSPVRGVAVGVPGPEQVFLNPAAADFAKWAQDWLDSTAPAIQAKAEQYGSNSLAAVGHLSARLQGGRVAEIEALERGCAVYAFGKMERVMDALLRGELPGRDTWHDLACYSLMVLFMREFGRWP